jgi:hypothetical protein
MPAILALSAFDGGCGALAVWLPCCCGLCGLGLIPKALAETPMDDRQKRYKEFWTGFSDYLSEHDPQYGNSAPPKDHWWAFGIGRTGFTFTVSAGGRDHWICTEVFVHADAD